MELKLSSDDVRNVLIEWAQGRFPGVQFNDCTFTGYSYSREATLSYIEPEPEKPQLKEAA